MKSLNFQRGYGALKQKGMSFMEVITTMGIAGILASVGYVSYVYYFNVPAKLNALHQIGAQVLTRMQTCAEESILNTGKENFEADSAKNWNGCKTKKSLNLSKCEECEAPKVSADGKQICMTIKNDKFSQCVGYTPFEANKFKINVNYKVCAHDRTGGVHTAIWPYMTCDTDSDCEGNLKCLQGVGECQSTAECH